MIALALLFSPALLWAFFLMYCAINASRRSGKFDQAPLPVRALSYFLLAIGLVADVLFNVTIGSLVFLELPRRDILTFTKRCSSHLTSPTWRGAIARWVCTGWLNLFEENHCK